ncbi:glycosyltransferase [Tenacibaculum sp. SG-28]|uniref:glycosyltransferase n=1 Tax=Tenacibaculum sp. SG-28 TaxID=754426 RepID=UPI000CF46C73|nr:glycosyltransferase [Tenacibaculum sp. SG-28]PQJ23082.1 glycosyl transferase family 2 [Tenacibaculum sp. SG-28]
MKTAIIIPCYNEALRIDVSRYIDFIATHPLYHLCLVNDGSEDTTLEILNTIQNACSKRVTVIHLEKNKGKAAAIRTAAKYLYHQDAIRYIGYMDADLSTDFIDYKRLTQCLKQNDNLSLVFGSRKTNGFNNIIKRGNKRKFFSMVIKSIINLILGLEISDTQCGAKVFKKEEIPLIYGKAFVSKWLFDVEIFLRLKKRYGKEIVMQKIKEEPLLKWIGVEGSKITISDSVQIPVRLLNIWVTYSVMNTFDIR